jgi:hypothetical protein
MERRVVLTGGGWQLFATRGFRAKGVRVPAVALVSAFSVFSVGLAIATSADAAPTTSAMVDFSKVIARTPASSIGFTATTFGVEGGPVTKSPADIAALKKLGAGSVRIHLKPNSNGQIVSGAGGGDASVSAAEWLDVYRSTGAAPTVIVNLDVADATAVVRYLVANSYDVNRFIIGNEMDANSKADVSQAEYTTKFHQIAAAMRAVKPGIEVGGPGVACWDCFNEQWVKSLLDAAPNERPSFIDYHAYGAGDGKNATMQSALVYNEQLPKLRQWINDPTVGVQVGEFNMNWGNESQNNTQTQAVWMANALGSILSNGGVAFQYGDKNNAMGLTSNNGAPKASYRAMGMFTGAGEFRRFGGTMVQSTSSDESVKIYASNDAKNVVVVNSGEATTLNLSMKGYVDGTARVWQSDELDLRDRGTAAVRNGTLNVDIPATSITTFVFDDSNDSGQTTPMPSVPATVPPVKLIEAVPAFSLSFGRK